MKRTVIEIVFVVLAVAAIFGLWKWADVNAQRAVGETVQRHEMETTRLQQGAAEWAKALAASQAEAVFEAFASGIQPAVLADSQDSLAVSKQQLLHLPNLAFVHLLEPDGTVIFSSDEKLTVAGTVGERARWALDAADLIQRPGELEGTLELAAPIEGVSQTEAVLWMGYDVSGLAADARPASLTSAAPPAGE